MNTPYRPRSGIVPPEVTARRCATGRPVIALGRGGALETVTSETGVFFPEQTVDSLQAAVGEFERREGDFDPAAARTRATQFSRAAFQAAFRSLVEG